MPEPHQPGILWRFKGVIGRGIVPTPAAVRQHHRRATADARHREDEGREPITLPHAK